MGQRHRDRAMAHQVAPAGEGLARRGPRDRRRPLGADLRPTPRRLRGHGVGTRGGGRFSEASLSHAPRMNETLSAPCHGREDGRGRGSAPPPWGAESMRRAGLRPPSLLVLSRGRCRGERPPAVWGRVQAPTLVGPSRCAAVVRVQLVRVQLVCVQLVRSALRCRWQSQANSLPPRAQVRRRRGSRVTPRRCTPRTREAPSGRVERPMRPASCRGDQ